MVVCMLESTRADLRGLVDEKVSALSSAAEAEALLVELERLKRHVEVATARLVDRVTLNGWFQVDGCVSTVSWLRTRVNWSAAEAKRVVRVADFVRHYPQVADQMSEGVLASGPVTRLAGLHANKRVTAQLPEFIDLLWIIGDQFHRMYA